MKFNNVYEEEYFFPYEGLSLEENREIRYLLSNSFDFLDGDIVQMRLIKNEEIIIAMVCMEVIMAVKLLLVK